MLTSRRPRERERGRETRLRPVGGNPSLSTGKSCRSSSKFLCRGRREKVVAKSRSSCGTDGKAPGVLLRATRCRRVRMAALLEDLSDGAEPTAVPLYASCSDLTTLQGVFVEYLTHQGDELYDSVSQGCGCTCVDGDCMSNGLCACLEDHGCFFKDGTLALDDIPPRHALFECGRHCACHERKEICGNRTVQRGIQHPLYVAITGKRGLGLFTRDALSKGAFICLYEGERLDEAEAAKRWEAQRVSGQSNFILAVRENSNAGKLSTIIDPRRRGNAGRFSNHACPPLANMIPCLFRMAGDLHPLIAMIASRDIPASTELTWDYGVIMHARTSHRRASQ
ncbi:uncharacterized protein L969DRAFT_96342 [Mixia osmundae IAM 14324]|uniref:SET domain-containing protein n=1 Tax=Mixia osmundae (strain CBS 9802 / IAM 14324 / JCM 22182 / KY 12970) TaxID=764103 RepID=G7DV04_MIXOS|nr:uncharacterized protein L969DRAFT_96342 [Mixia osmundae IAM 14324]KEI37253.1 hypothetical protein L969DRAFT_96342 [Mixia osmundae IAM 14324]GAA94414.1 hypothetical protein E5Q_01066 [Mixia osmundae IAM 14324]